MNRVPSGLAVFKANRHRINFALNVICTGNIFNFIPAFYQITVYLSYPTDTRYQIDVFVEFKISERQDLITEQLDAWLAEKRSMSFVSSFDITTI